MALQKVEMLWHLYFSRMRFAELILLSLCWTSICSEPIVIKGKAKEKSERLLNTEKGKTVVSALGLLERESSWDVGTWVKMGASVEVE